LKSSIELRGSDDLLVTATVAGPFGVEGFVRVLPESGDAAHLARLDSVFSRKRKGREVLATEVLYIEGFRQLKGCGLVKFKGIDSPEAAKALSGAELLVPRKNAAPLSSGEYYVEDLRGLTLRSTTCYSAVIANIVEGGGGYLLDVTLPTGEQRLVPFRHEFVGKIDLEAATVELLVDWILE
jgi:16S rRNA processing protein RimM